MTPHAQHASHYRLRAAAAGTLINPHRWKVDTEGSTLAAQAQEEGGEQWFISPAQALDWVAQELPDIVAACESLTHRPAPWMIADHLGPHLLQHADQDMARRLYELGLESARATGHMAAHGLMLQRAASIGASHGTDDPARAAYDLYEQVGHQEGMASALEQIGAALVASGDLDEAEATFAETEIRHRELGRERGALLQYRKWAQVRAAQGRPEEAADGYARAHHGMLDLPQGPDVYQATRALQAMVGLLLAERAGDVVTLAAVEMLAGEGLSNAQRTGMAHQEASLRDVLEQVRQARA